MKDFSTQLSQRIRGTDTEKVRALFAAAARPGIISFAAGSPHLGTQNFPALADSAQRVMLENGPAAMQYSAAAGYRPLAEEICAQVMPLEGIEADPGELIVTPGSQMGLDLISKVLLDPGDVVIAESPSYAGGMAVLGLYQAEVWQVDTDAHGLVPDAVDAALARAAAAGRRVKFVYTIPNFQNPGGTLMPLARRAQLIEVAERHDVLVVEDNAYGLLGFDGQTYRAMAADHRDRVIYCGSFSKFIGPGLRLGWLLPPAGLRDALLGASETAMLNPPTFAQMVMARHLATSDWLDVLVKMRELYRDKAEVMLRTLAEVMPAGATWNTPVGGFYVWVRMPERFETFDLALAALDRGVGYVPGSSFYTDGRGTHELRMSYCLPSLEDIETGVRRLGEVFAAADGRN